MKISRLIALCGILLVASCARPQEAREPQIIPQPAFIQTADGVFTIDRNTPVYIDEGDSALLRTVGFLNDKLSKAASSVPHAAPNRQK